MAFEFLCQTSHKSYGLIDRQMGGRQEFDPAVGYNGIVQVLRKVFAL